MGLEKLLKKLNNHLTKQEHKSSDLNCERIDVLMEKLVKKKKILKESLDTEKGKMERKHLKLEFKIVSRELKKAGKRRDELTGECNES